MGFAANLQTSHAALVTLQDGELRLLENMRRCVVLRIKCDREYSVALNSVHNQALKLDTPDDLKSSGIIKSWNSVSEETELLSQLIKKNSDYLATHTLETLNNLIAEKRALRKHYAEEHTRIHGELSKLQECVVKTKHDYEKYLDSWKVSKTRYEDLYMKAGKPGKKLDDAKDKYQKVTRKLHKVHNDYVLLLCEASEYEQKLRNVLIPDLLNYQQTVLQESVETWKSILKEYTHYTDIANESSQILHERMRKAVEIISSEEEYNAFSLKHKSCPIQPITFKFDEHLLQDYTGKLKPYEIAVDDYTLETLKTRMQDVWNRLSQAQSDLHSRETQMAQYELEITSLKISPETLLSINVKKRAVDILRKQIGELHCQEEIFKRLWGVLDGPLNSVGPEGPEPALQLEEITSSPDDDTASIAGTAVGRSARMVLDRFWGSIHHKRQQSTSTTTLNSPRLSPRNVINTPKPKTPDLSIGDLSTSDGYSLMNLNLGRLLQEEDWFHGVLPREEVVRLLAKDGDYLVRQTTRNEENQIVLSTRWHGHKHFIVQTTLDGKFRFEGPSFTTIQELVMYQHNCGQPVTIRSGAVLSNPVIRERWELNNDDVQLRDKIGRGNFGDVYSAVLKPSGLEVAVKTCRMNLPDEQKKKFLQEGRILKQYDHPNIVKFIGICVQKQPIMIVMELVPGGSLLTFLRNQGQHMHVLDLLTLCIDAASGMEYLESKGCIHRDLAARNCLVGKNKEVKISDFGMSREEEEYIVSDGMKQIPIKWTAPEALNFGKYNSLCDVWSYGVLMWEVFSLGSTPYCGLSNNRTRELIDSGYRLPSPENTPGAVYEIMLRCWEYDPDRRIHFPEIHTVLQAIAGDYR